jgi:hypothetical protein
MIVRYAAATVLNLVFTALAYLLAPIVAAFCKPDGYLPDWLAWFQTQDAPLDAGWRDGYFGAWKASGTTPRGFALWWVRVLWLWRNPAYGFCYWPLGIAYDPQQWVIDALEHDGATLVTLRAHTKDGRYFAYTDSTGCKLGFKLWWALDDDFKLIAALPASRGPDNRLPIAFTPSLSAIFR